MTTFPRANARGALWISTGHGLRYDFIHRYSAGRRHDPRWRFRCWPPRRVAEVLYYGRAEGTGCRVSTSLSGSVPPLSLHAVLSTELRVNVSPEFCGTAP